MAMSRSLDSGVTGMLNSQVSLDVSANNLANVNTPGFKGSRVSFSNALIQTNYSGSAPGTNIGGQNPKQVGMGVATSSIDIDMGQGSLSATGRSLDLAIQGDGFFEVNDGTRSFYTRVGSFGIDSADNLVHLSSGYRLSGNSYRTDVNPDGSQTIQDQNIPITIPQGQAFPPNLTTEVSFQGNLDADSKALQGTSLQAVYALSSTLTELAATEDTPLTELNIFNGATGLPATTQTMSIFGTKPNGQTYAADFDVNPWAVPTASDSTGSFGDLLGKINAGLAQGNERFGTARLENGNLIISAVGAGESFSFFLGERSTDPSLAPYNTESTPATLTLDDTLDTAVLTSANTSNGVATIVAADVGLLNPAFTINQSPTSAFTIAVLVNGSERGSISVPATAAAADTFNFSSFPHVATGDTVEYVTTGMTADGTTITPVTGVILDSISSNMTSDTVDSDLNAASPDGIADMFTEDSNVDANAWQYRNETNGNFNWYRMRAVPEVVSSSIEVYDSQGGRHNVECRYFRVGTRTEADGDARINSWDVIINIPSGEGEITDDLITGIEFDQKGRFTGSVGTTIHSSSLNSTQYVGNPASATIGVSWATTGPTDPSTIRFDLGDNNSFTGLTGFGSPSTAAAIGQDGYTDGKLDTISVSSEGDVVALYTNGISRKLAQIPLVTFANPEGLAGMEGNLWQQSTNSGSATRRAPGQNSGFISAGALESSNVDIATEFTRLITAQRGFQVSARVVQTTDEILEELANLVR